MPARRLTKGYYVYAIEVDDVIRYVGMGKWFPRQVNRRFGDHMRAMRRIIRYAVEGLSPRKPDLQGIGRQLAHVYLDGAIVREIIVASELQREGALALERAEIKRLGYRQLWNKPPSKPWLGKKFTPKMKKEMRRASMRYHEANPDHGRRMANARWGNVIPLKRGV